MLTHDQAVVAGSPGLPRLLALLGWAALGWVLWDWRRKDTDW